MTVRAAFFVGSGSLADALIRWRTNSEASHVELFVGDNSYSSYPGVGVRTVPISSLPKGKWKIVNLPWVNDKDVLDFFETTKGAKYDWLGVIVGQAISARIAKKGDFFCSEWCAQAIGMTQTWRYSPGLLMDIVGFVDHINKNYEECISNN